MGQYYQKTVQLYIPNNIGTKCMKQNLTELRGEKYNSIIIEDFNTLL